MTLPYLLPVPILRAVTERKPITSLSWLSVMKKATAKNSETAVLQSPGAMQKPCTICTLQKLRAFRSTPLFLPPAVTLWKNIPEQPSKLLKIFMKWQACPCLLWQLFQKAVPAELKPLDLRINALCFPMAIIQSFLRRERLPLKADSNAENGQVRNLRNAVQKISI